MKDVREIREKEVYPICRARYQVLGLQYANNMIESLRSTYPLIYENSKKRDYFIDFLMQTGDFTDPLLD